MNSKAPIVRVEPRDSQRSKVYKAEDEVFSGKPIGGKDLPTVPEIEAFLANKVWGRKSVQDLFGRWMTDRVRVKDGRGRRSASGGRYALSLPAWARTEWIILHELTHTLTIRQYGRSVASHGREFCRTYVLLVECVLGRPAATALRASFKKHKVRYHLKKGGS